MSNAKSLIHDGLLLKPVERLLVIEALVRSLDMPNSGVEEAWVKEAEDRLAAYKAGKLETISFEESFK